MGPGQRPQFWRAALHFRDGRGRRGRRFHPGSPRGASMGYIVLLGDSVFDNGAYVRPGEPDVVRQLLERLPAGWRATLAAVDGAVTGSVLGQLARLPPDATHLVLSTGGNDALRQQDVLDLRVRSVAEALLRLAEVRDGFARDYRAMLGAVLGQGLPTALCTIYDPRFPEPTRQQV